MPLSKRLAAEFLGTLWLVLGGCGSAVIAGTFPQYGIAFAGVAKFPARVKCALIGWSAFRDAVMRAQTVSS